MTDTKISGLGRMNTRALREAFPVEEFSVAITASTATFIGKSPAEAIADLDAAMNRLAAIHGRKQHPVASLHAVRRRLVKAGQA